MAGKKQQPSNKNNLYNLVRLYMYAALEDLSAKAVNCDAEDPFKGPAATYYELATYATPDKDSGLKQAFQFPDSSKQFFEFSLNALVEDVNACKFNSNDTRTSVPTNVEDNTDTDSSFLLYLHNLHPLTLGAELSTQCDKDAFITGSLRQNCRQLSKEMYDYLETVYTVFLKNIAVTCAGLWWYGVSKNLDVDTLSSVLVGSGMSLECLKRLTSNIKWPEKKPAKKKATAAEKTEPVPDQTAAVDAALQ